ncbi:hypothetical protein ABIB26_004726 [Arthrobacter sp. UYEF20]
MTPANFLVLARFGRDTGEASQDLGMHPSAVLP